jgi:hypothetical protein
MANSHNIVKVVGASALDIAGFNRTRYDSLEVAYGTIASGTYVKNDFFYFGQVPSKTIIAATFTTDETSPVTVSIGPSFNLSNVVHITANNGGTAVGVDYVIYYDNIFSGAVGQTLTLKVS